MIDERYAPPSAKVADVGQGAEAPPLWNPNAAANWSLMFSPAFGAFLHMKNWQALGEPSKALLSKRWCIITLVVFAANLAAAVAMPESRSMDGISRLSGLVLLIAWYVSAGRGQASYVKSRFGSNYERRPWGKPLLIAFGALFLYFVLAAAIGFLTGMLRR